MAYNKEYYAEKKKTLGERMIAKKDTFINQIFSAVQELSKIQQEITADYQDIIKREEAEKEKESPKDEVKKVEPEVLPKE